MPTLDFTVEPGAFIEEWIEENHTSQRQLALRMGVSPKHVNSLINGGVLTVDSAIKLERATSVPSAFWLRMEARYRTDLVRLTEAGALAKEDLSFVHGVPCLELRQMGLITKTLDDQPQLIQELMTFFRTGALSALRDHMSLPKTARQRGKIAPNKEAAVVTWLRLGEIEVETQASAQPFDPKALEGLMPEIHKLKIRPSENFERELTGVLAKAGVHLACAPTLSDVEIRGALWWKNDHPVIQLSPENKDSGTFWFTLFHEMGHALLHGPGGTFLDFTFEETTDKMEREADEFANSILFPQDSGRKAFGFTVKS